MNLMNYKLMNYDSLLDKYNLFISKSNISNDNNGDDLTEFFNNNTNNQNYDNESILLKFNEDLSSQIIECNNEINQFIESSNTNNIIDIDSNQDVYNNNNNINSGEIDLSHANNYDQLLLLNTAELELEGMASSSVTVGTEDSKTESNETVIENIIRELSDNKSDNYICTDNKNDNTNTISDYTNNDNKADHITINNNNNSNNNNNNNNNKINDK